MIIPIVGPSSQQRSVVFNSERSINLYAIADKDGKNQTMLQGTPGLALFATAGTGPGRGCFTSALGRVFIISAGILFELFSNGTSTNRGTLLTTGGIVELDENGVQLYIGDGTYGYIFTYATNVFVQITDVDFPATVGTVSFIGGYFIVNQTGTGKFYVSDLYNGLSWQSLNFATAESSPDNLVRILAVQGQLWLLGAISTEVWTPNGSIRFPFSLISGAIIDMGILGPYCALSIDNGAMFIGNNKEGSRIVYKTQGFVPQRISTEPMEKLLATATNLNTLRMWKYQQEGHLFAMITGGGMSTSLCYDITTQQWHERAYLNVFGDYECHRAADCMAAFDKILTIDRINGNVYTMALDIYSDNGDAIPADRIMTNLSQENKNVRFSKLTVDLESGVGLETGQGVDPQIVLSLSNDGARTWFAEQSQSIGAVGNYRSRVIFKRLGMARTRTFRLRITDPIKRSFVGAYLN